MTHNCRDKLDKGEEGVSKLPGWRLWWPSNWSGTNFQVCVVATRDLRLEVGVAHQLPAEEGLDNDLTTFFNIRVEVLPTS